MNTWKKTKESLGLGDEEVSAKVKKLIKKHEKWVADLATVKNALAAPGISQADKEEYESAETEIKKRVFDSDEELKAHMIRLHRDRDLNKARRERLASKPGPGRGNKKGATPVVPITTTTAAPATTSDNSTGNTPPPATGSGTTAAPAAAPGSAPAATGTTSQGKPPSATPPAPNPAKPSTTATPANPPEGKKKNTMWKAVVCFMLGGAIGALVGKNLK